MTAIQDSEYNAMAKAGEIVSQLTQLGEKIKTLVAETEAKAEIAKRQEKTVLRGVLDVKSVSDSFIASFQNVAPAEVNGKSIPYRPGPYVRGVGTDMYEAIKALALEMKQVGQ